MPRIYKWGNVLAVRIPAAFVRKLGLRAGDRVDLHAKGGPVITFNCRRRLGGILTGLRRFRERPPENGNFPRLEAHDRFPVAFKKARGTVDPEIDLGH